ncbi:MAG TPA: Zn-dependent alcohol dehydrogenase [Acidimicrobiia bacterium]|jgi:S-(hydroxymethyl)glutathione dehydrogenase/alcohol dehydrogenase|nr:Zn-dependent alcohol dehydrogenase [Acidimicrobiia bacterium]
MRAAIFVEPNGDLVVEDVTPTDPGPRDVVVQVTASGVCHSDLSVINGTLPMPPPAILGHEGTGVVESVGSEVSRVKKGDRVIGSFIPACGVCWFCRNQQTNLCEQTYAVMAPQRATRGDGSPLMTMTGLGTFSDVMTCNEISLVKVDTDLPDEELALIGCGVTTGVGAALNTAKVIPGSTVAVVGCGGVGQAVIQGASIAGAARIIAVDPVELKRATALELGATDTVDPSAGNPVAQVQELTGGRGADYAFEVIGNPATVLQAFDMTRAGGACVVVGVPRFDQTIDLPTMPLILQEKRVLGTVYGSAQVNRDFPRLIGLVEQGRLDLGHMVSRRMKLDEINDALRAMQAGEVIRSVIT